MSASILLINIVRVVLVLAVSNEYVTNNIK